MKYFSSLISLLVATTPLIVAAEGSQPDMLDEITITSTLTERASQSVPTAITSIGEEKLNQLRMNSISDALQDIPGVVTYSKNGLSSSKLIIRGAGLKARYGIREIMIVRDGIPLTEPDSFTRLDTIDGQDIERLEVTKGPGNIYASGSSGGTIHVITKSVFDQDKGRIKLGINDDGGKDLHLRTGTNIGDNQAISLTLSHREVPNSWRERNDQSSEHISLKHGIELSDTFLLETEIGYSKIDMELQSAMNDTQWQDFLATGKQTGKDSQFKHTGRYSRNLFMNTKAEIELDSMTIKPKLYYSQYHHIHPVTGFINDNSDNPPNMIGLDVAVEKEHQLGQYQAEAVFGVAGRINETKDAKKYTYADIATIPSGRITSTLSDKKGLLANVESTKGTLLGVYASEHIKFSEQLSIDMTARFDDVELSIDENEIIKYDYASGNYATGSGQSSYKHQMNLLSASLGASYALNNTLNVYSSISMSDQVPAESELNNNPNLKKANNQNIEIGLKGRSNRWSFDTSIYHITGNDEIIQLQQPNGESLYVNAGKTSKKGFEFATSYQALKNLSLGMNLTLNHYKYDNFQEQVRVGRSVINVDRSGNYLPLIPMQQMNVYAEYQFANGFSMQVKLRKDGDYYLDNANSEKWEDNKLLADLNLRYKKANHQIELSINNLTNEYYATEVIKDTSGKKTYTAGAPRSMLLNYRYNF